MTAEEFAERVLLVRDNLTAALVDALPSECEVIDRFILSGVTDEAGWLAALRTDNVIRKLIVLLANYDLDTLNNTHTGRQFHPIIRFNLELYHDYSPGSNSQNTESDFISDSSKILFALGKGRTLGGPAIITKASLRAGMRPSKVQTLHYGKGEVIVDLRDIQYS